MFFLANIAKDHLASQLQFSHQFYSKLFYFAIILSSTQPLHPSDFPSQQPTISFSDFLSSSFLIHHPFANACILLGVLLSILLKTFSKRKASYYSKISSPFSKSKYISRCVFSNNLYGPPILF